MDFELENRYTLEDLKRYNRYLFFQRRKWFYAACFAVMLLMLGILVWLGSYQRALLCVLIIGLTILLVWLSLERSVKKLWNTNELLHEPVHFHFWEQGVEISAPSGYSRIEYPKFYRLYETKTDFYLMISTNQGHLIPKAICTEGQRYFIRTHILGKGK